MARVARLVVIGIEHLGRHRLAETSATRHTTETAFGEKGIIDNGDKPRLVNIFAVPYSLEPSIADIDICAHNRLDFAAKVALFCEPTKLSPK